MATTMTPAVPIYSNNFATSVAPFTAQSGTIGLSSGQMVVTPVNGYEGARYIQTLDPNKVVNISFKMRGANGVAYIVFDAQTYAKLAEGEDWSGSTSLISVAKSFTTPSHGRIDIALVSGSGGKPAYFDDFALEYAAVTSTDNATSPPVTVPPTTSPPTTSPPATTTATSVGWRTEGNQIVDGAGKYVRFTGVNITGPGASPGVMNGIGLSGYKQQLDLVKSLGFNHIRWCFTEPTVNSTAKLTSSQCGKSTDLVGKTAFEAMKIVLEYATSIGLYTILDCHRPNWDGINGEWGMSRNGLWYETRASFGGLTTPQDAINTWKTVASALKGNMGIVGADLHNEPSGPATWNTSTDIGTNWPAFCEACGNAILAINPDWLIVVEGVETGAQPYGNYVGPGTALQGVKNRPVVLSIPNKVMYSAHPYGPELSPSFDPWKDTNGFPGNVPNYLYACWGYVFYDNIAPVYLGEFGAPLDNGDAKALTYAPILLKFMAGSRNGNDVSSLSGGKVGMSWARWEWGPYSGDTKGILDSNASDFVTVNQTRYNSVKPYLFAGSITKPISGAVSGPVSPPPPPPPPPVSPPPPPPPPPPPVTSEYGQWTTKNVREVLSTQFKTIYTAPAGVTAVLSMAAATNVHPVSPVTATVQWMDASASNAVTNVIKNAWIDLHGSTPISVGMLVLQEGDKLQALCSVAGGIEMTANVIEFKNS